jgi:hypothetical protein
MVRISHLKTEFQRSYQEQFTTEIFKVYRRYLTQGLPFYELCDFQNQEIRGSFYQSELQKVFKDQDALWYVDTIMLRFYLGRLAFFTYLQRGFKIHVGPQIRLIIIVHVLRCNVI